MSTATSMSRCMNRIPRSLSTRRRARCSPLSRPVRRIRRTHTARPTPHSATAPMKICSISPRASSSTPSGCGARVEASVIGGKFRTTTAYAAYANAVIEHAPELEAVGSVGPNVAQNIAAVLALGEKLKAPGWKVIESIVLGFEIQARVWNGAIASASSRGWVLPFNHVGAVSSACKILDLDVEPARAPLRIALTTASVAHPHET